MDPFFVQDFHVGDLPVAVAGLDAKHGFVGVGSRMDMPPMLYGAFDGPPATIEELRNDITKYHLMPTLDNIADSVNYRLNLFS